MTQKACMLQVTHTKLGYFLIELNNTWYKYQMMHRFLIFKIIAKMIANSINLKIMNINKMKIT